MPLLVLITLGVFEFGIFFWNTTYAQSASSSAARTGVTQSRATDYQLAVRDAATAAMSNVRATPLTLTVFKADPSTGRPTSGVVGKDYSICTVDCYSFNWNISTRTWVPVTGVNWLPGDQAACGPVASTDFLGVQIRFRHNSVTGALLRNKVITVDSVMRLEPVSTAGGQDCKP